MKAVLVPFSGKVSSTALLGSAFKFAKEQGASVTCLHVSPDVHRASLALGEGLIYAVDGLEEDVKISHRKLLNQARKTFSAVAEYVGVEVGDGKQAQLVHEVGPIDELIVRYSRFHDVIFMRQTGVEKSVEQDIALNTALFGTGKPVVVTPQEESQWVSRRVAIAWSDSKEAAAALQYSLPVLRNAGSVFLIHGQVPSKKESGNDLEQVSHYLQRHGIGAVPHVIADGNALPENILNKCTELGAEMLVMGAFTHHRVRQLIIGGVTSYVLKKATIPLFMAH